MRGCLGRKYYIINGIPYRAFGCLEEQKHTDYLTLNKANFALPKLTLMENRKVRVRFAPSPTAQQRTSNYCKALII